MPKTAKPRKRKYTFSLIGVKITEVERKYGLDMSSTLNQEDDDIVVPTNATCLQELDSVASQFEVVSFLDESKKLRKCNVAMIDHQSRHELGKGSKYCCFWDHHPIPEYYIPIGCPIKYIPHIARKTYVSETSKNNYTIIEEITDKKKRELESKENSGIDIYPNGYYLTDGIFCSFNCCIAYIEENKKNPLYEFSHNLLLEMYRDLHGDVPETIRKAPHSRQLVNYGGYLTIDQFRSNFNKFDYTYHGMIVMHSVGHIYEENIKLN